YEIFTFKNRAVSDLSTLAEMISVSAQAALDFDDPKTAQEALDTLDAELEILSAGIYGANGAIFASYVRPGLAAIQFSKPQPDAERFQGRELVLFRRIRSNGETIGT